MQTPTTNSVSGAESPTTSTGPHVPFRKGPQSHGNGAPLPNATPISLDNLQLQLQQIITTDHSESNLIQAFVEINAQLTNAVWSGYFSRVANASVQCQFKCNRIAEQNLGVNQSSLLPAVEAALKQQKPTIHQHGPLSVIATPVCSATERKATGECFCVALNLGKESPGPFMLITQLVSATKEQWNIRNQFRNLDWQIDCTAAIAELMSKIVSVRGRKNGTIVAANELSVFLRSTLVAIGCVNGPTSKSVRVQAISGITEIDASGRQTRLLQSLLSETLIRDCVTTLPTIGNDDVTTKLAHQELLEKYPGHRIVSSPLKTSDDRTVGAWVCLLPDSESQHQRLIRFAEVTSGYLADALQANRQAALGAGARLATQVYRFFGCKLGRIIAVAAIVFAMAMFVPVPHRVDCVCQLKPTVRRFAVAPQDGILLEATVEPGDIVCAGQVIARMDDRELSLQITELIAKLEAAEKKRDVSRSSNDPASTQSAELEMEQLQAQVQFAKYQKGKLEIRSLRRRCRITRRVGRCERRTDPNRRCSDGNFAAR